MKSTLISREPRYAAKDVEAVRLTGKGFAENIGAIRKRARQPIEQGSVTDSNKVDRNAVLSPSNDALATELANMLKDVEKSI